MLGFTVSPEYPILVLAVLLVIQFVDANTVVPMVMNRVVSLPALGVVLALLVGGAIQGLIGALLAVPVAAALQVLLVRAAVPAIHHAQGRTDQAYAKAYVPLSPSLKDSAPAARVGGASTRADRSERDVAVLALRCRRPACRAPCAARR